MRRILGDKNVFTRGDRKREFPFREVIYCQNCGSKCYPSASGKHEKILYLRCGQRTDKCLNKGKTTGKSIIDYTSNAYRKLAELITKKDYEEILRKYKERKQNTLLHNNDQIKILQSQMRELQVAKANKEKIVTYTNDTLTLEEYTKEIEEIVNKMDSVGDQMIQIQKKIIKFNSSSPLENMSFEKFSNFLKNAPNKLVYSHDIYLVDKMVKMVFSNIKIDTQGIASARLNPLFQKYQNEVISQYGVEDGI